MASDVLRTIVDGLNNPPFKKRLTLVTFDEKTPFELLQILNDVLEYLDPSHGKVDLRDEPQEQTGTRMAQFLHMLKFQYPQNQIDEFKAGLVNGQRDTIYPVLVWLLSRLPGVKKRAYLAKFLINIDVPAEFFQDNDIKSVFEHYKNLQVDFKNVHKMVDKLRSNNLAPNELKREIKQLEDERMQLKEKISQLRRKTENMSGFRNLLEVTSALRRQQEEETKLNERKREQLHNLHQAKLQFSDVDRQLRELEQSPTLRMGPQQLLDHLTKKVAEKKAQVKEILPRQMAKMQEALRNYQDIMAEPKSEGDVRDLEDKIRSVGQHIYDLEQQIKRNQANLKDDRLIFFRQQAALVKKKLAEKEEQLAQAENEGNELKQQVEDKEAVLSELTGPQFMQREEFKQFASKLRTKTNRYKKLKTELANIRAESVVLSRTEQILRSRDENLQDLMDKIEETHGVKGYMQTQEALVQVSRAGASTDQLKGKTLEEISAIVQNINVMLKERKNRLAPQIKELRTVRQQYQELEQIYNDKKAQYENTAAGLESDRLKLENAADLAQEESLREESRFHHLHCLIAISSSRLHQIHSEKSFLNSNTKDRLHRDFKSYSELYANKLSSQLSLSKVLHKRQKELKENAGDFLKQKQMFTDLSKLLDCKKSILVRQQEETKHQGEANIAMFDTIVDGANVMKIE